jgi:CHASE2 domain-containing sensor protein
MVVLRVALLWMIGYVFFVFHGLSFHLTPWSQAFINAIVNYTYGKQGQEDTTVLLFREENLRQLGVQYPVPYSVHAQVLEALASYGPRAVFIDFAFIDPREGEAELRDALCALRRGNAAGQPVRVFLAAPGGAPVRAELLKCAETASPEMDENVGVSGVLTYVSHSEGGLRTAAFALAASNPVLGFDERSLKAPLEIIWGKGVPRINREWMKCTEPSFLHGIWHMLTHGPLANKLACPYTRTITVGHLLSFSKDQDVDNALAGRTVLYGAGFRLTGDLVNSPVYAELPGVYLHAMAYDNLATFRRGYKRATRHGLGAMITDAALLLVASVLLVRYPRTPRHRAESFGELKARLRRHGLVGAAVVVAIVALAGLGGFDVGLLSLVLAYVLYRWWISKDLGFVLLVTITIVTALFYYYVMNLGPRNILAFLVFFEVVRHVEKHLKEMAERYFELKRREASTPQGPLWRLADAFLARYAQSGANHDGRREAVHEAEESRATG